RDDGYGPLERRGRLGRARQAPGHARRHSGRAARRLLGPGACLPHRPERCRGIARRRGGRQV
ncbi:MAG: hypothetical protein AVDCRST_MAG12-1468, partial [uncultured Rubrobacteraceae bacterium]